KSVSFVGSTPIAQYVYATGTAAGKRVQALGGAKNHAVILPDATSTWPPTPWSTPDCSAGNAAWPSPPRRRRPIADDLVAKIAERAATITTGDGTKNSDMGPLVTKAHRDKVAS
ncbi:aldehyde dehydrogenase family protein, partial [Mycobacterium rufum]|nr:aldehyde dehydrogenase family protein [Mycolicibacterium rufum]